MNSYFFVGIKGVAMANLARIYRDMGNRVAGSDVAEVFITDHELEGIQIITSFEASLLPSDVHCVVYSAAHGGDQNPQVIEAKKRGIVVKHQAHLIGELMDGYGRSIAVSGCHGKTTTSSLLAYALTRLKAEPGYMVGVSEFAGMYGGSAGKKDLFVCEADEYAIQPPYDKTPKFLFLHPTHAIITNIDFDHPDVYRDIHATREAFEAFLAGMKQKETPRRIVICADDTEALSATSTVPRERILSYGFLHNADVAISKMMTSKDQTTFELASRELDVSGTYKLSLFGEKNVSNAAAVITMLAVLGYKKEAIQNAIGSFTGAKRRFEHVGSVGSHELFDDYAHHPAEIAATIAAARLRYPGRRIILIFQPHTFTRTQSLKHEFVTAFIKADLAILLPIFGSARETPSLDPITSQDLVTEAQKRGMQTVSAVNSPDELLTYLKSQIRQGDIIFTVGAGDVYKLAPAIISALEV